MLVWVLGLLCLPLDIYMLSPWALRLLSLGFLILKGEAIAAALGHLHLLASETEITT